MEPWMSTPDRIKMGRGGRNQVPCAGLTLNARSDGATAQFLYLTSGGVEGCELFSDSQ